MKADYHWDGCWWCGKCDQCIDHKDCWCTRRTGEPDAVAHDRAEAA